jgi:predicted kinase
MTVQIPELSLVLLMGVSGSGKSTFARRHFRATEILGPHVVRQQVAELKKSLWHLESEGFRYRHVLTSPEEIEVATIEECKHKRTVLAAATGRISGSGSM